ncbi:MAG: hypothetical protein AAF108_10775 [Planctomycetota bacterium]
MSTEQFVWEPQPAAAGLVRELQEEALAGCAFARELAERMTAETGTRFVDWLDSIVVPAGRGLEPRLIETGFTPESLPGAPSCYIHHGGLFPKIVIEERGSLQIAIKVESVSDFLSTHRLHDASIRGGEGMPLRVARVACEGQYEMWVVERHGDHGFEPHQADAEVVSKMAHHRDAIRRRPRTLGEDEGFRAAQSLVEAAVRDLGQDVASDLWFWCERDEWQRRNHAARVQYGRQQALGLGWANHDHHTYRSSREHYTKLIKLLETVGMSCRERFYAGEEAGWGAQVLEQFRTGFVVFADVDMEPEEVAGDFAHDGFGEKPEMGTVGLWCALHGDSAVGAGMHHLECQFDWHALKQQLETEAGISTMAPFTTFPFLRQAFTEGERWAVDPARVDALLAGGQITPAQAEAFRTEGAVGSHLENLERNDGYKGFNQTGVSDIISRTDPRKLAEV